MLAYNILEAAYAIKYPRAPLPPLVSPAKPKAAVAATPHQPFKLLSPKARNYSECHIWTYTFITDESTGSKSIFLFAERFHKNIILLFSSI